MTIEDIEGQAEAFVQVIGKLSVKERAAQPYAQYGERFNQVLALAKEALPAIDSRLWPPAIEVPRARMGPSHAAATYAEIETYAKQLLRILGQHSALPAGPIRG